MAAFLDACLRRFAARRLARMRRLAADPQAAQQRVFVRLQRAMARTACGRTHGIGQLRGPEDLARAVPLQRYEDCAPAWQRARAGEPDVCWPGVIRYWALSSGTTSGEKFLPVSAATIRSNRGGGVDALVPHLASSAASLSGGRLLFLGGSTALRQEGPVWIGDNTGIMARHVPRWVRHWHAPGRSVAALPDWEQKIERAARELVGTDLRMLSGVPSWIVLFAERVLDQSGRRNLVELWPQLQLFVHGGVAFAPYRARCRELFGADIRCTDTYSASEGGMLAVQDLPDARGMLPIVDRGVYFEFVPPAELGRAQPTALPLHAVEPDVDYAVVLTTDSGLCRYLLGDVVRFDPGPIRRLQFAGRLAHTLNAFGEHVSGGELDRAIAAAAEATQAIVAEFAVAPVFPDAADARGGHRYYVEFVRAPGDLGAFTAQLDRSIAAGNADYATHRQFGLRQPIAVPMPRGTFLAVQRHRGKVGGQHKVPRVLPPAWEQELTAVGPAPG